MKQFVVMGMSCAACSARVEKAVSTVDGVTLCSVNLLTNSMTVEGSASAQSIVAAVEKAGYGAYEKGGNAPKKDENNEKNETKTLLKRLASSVIFLLVLMYFSMGKTMLGLPLPAFFENNPMAVGLLEMLLSIVIMIINKKFFISGAKAVLHRSPNMDTLIALGSGAAFIYSTYLLFAMTVLLNNGDISAAMHSVHGLYYESSAMILTLITLGKMLESYSKGKTTNALSSLVKLKPQTATVIVDGKENIIDIDKLTVGDIFAVRPGENMPADGVVINGNSAVDESSLTGESVYIDKAVGDKISAATTNLSGYLQIKATHVGEDTTLSKIIKAVSDAASSKAPIAKAADKISGIFVPAVIGIALISTAIWLIVGQSFGYALARGISVLVISCPCALGLATPVAIMVGNGVGAKNGILFKNAEALEQTGKTKYALLDKTGTITLGKPKITDVLSVDETDDELIKAAYSLERLSEHPLSKAIVEYAADNNIEALCVDDFEAVGGRGICGVINGERIFGGNYDYISQKAVISKKFEMLADELASKGKTPLFFAKNDALLGIIAVADVVKPDSKSAIDELKGMGIKTIMLTGDNEKTAKAIADYVGIDEVVAGILPNEKDRIVSEYMKKGSVVMVGDGINDAPALTRADIGIAIGAGTDIAIDSADVVLMNSRLSDVPAAIRLSKATLKNIYENLFWAFIYNIIGIPLAAGAYVALLGWELNPMFGAAAMSLSSFCVVMNSLRLNFVKMHAKERADNNDKEKTIMTKTLKIEGMMCMHCEKRVKDTLEALSGVESADVSHEKGTAVITLCESVDDDVLINAVEAQGYKVIK